MKNITIKILNDEDTELAINRVGLVINGGMVSSSRHGPSYCILSRFKDDVMVYCRKTEKGFVFHVYKNESDRKEVEA